jgi:hypothetical protein
VGGCRLSEGDQSANTWRLHSDVAICGFNDVDRHIWLSIQSDSTGMIRGVRQPGTTSLAIWPRQVETHETSPLTELVDFR